MVIVRSCMVNLQHTGRTIRMAPVNAWRCLRCTVVRSA